MFEVNYKKCWFDGLSDMGRQVINVKMSRILQKHVFKSLIRCVDLVPTK